MTTYYTKLKFHLERHIYKRGKNKGDAPMGPRSKTHYLCIDRKDHMAVRFHNTDIIKAYPDGRITIDCNGWAGSITTKTHLNDALPGNMWMGSMRVMSESQLTIRTPAGRYRYYDGITFDAEGKPLTEIKPFLARRIDKDEVAELNRALDEYGFKDAFKVLWGACTPEDSQSTIGNNGHDWRWVKTKLDLFDMPDVHADKWRTMVAYFAFDEKWTRDPATGNHKKVFIKLTPSQAWANIMRWVKRDMYRSIETEVYEVSQA